MYYRDETKPGMRVFLKSTVWAGFVYALTALVFGVFTAVTPTGTLSVFVWAIGLFLLAHGVILLISALMGIKKDPHWYTSLGSAVIQLGLGLFIVMRSEAISNTALMFSTIAIGLTGVLTGTHNLIKAIRHREIIQNVWATAIRGGLLFVIGISMLLAPFGFGVAMMRSIGIFAALMGIFQLWTSIKLLRELKKDEAQG